MELWYSPAVKIPWKKPDGGRMIGGPARGTLHTTESSFYRPSDITYFGHVNPPHATVTPGGTVYQHIEGGRAARALAHRGGIDTNRMGRHNFQIEIVGYASKINDMPVLQVNALRHLMRWVEWSMGVNREMPLEFPGPEGYGVNSPYRMSGKAWANFDAWGGHSLVPGGKTGNAHWDPGKLDRRLLLERMEWNKPGDLVRNQADAVRVAIYQTPQDSSRLIAQMGEDETAIMIGRVLDLLMQHDIRLKELET